MQSYVTNVITEVSSAYGNEFFNKITLALHNINKADYSFITMLDKEAMTSSTLAMVAKGKLIDNITYTLAGTPCAKVVADSLCLVQQQVRSSFPNDQRLIDFHISTYLGYPLINSAHEVIGLIVSLYEKKTHCKEAVTLFAILAGRMVAELERNTFEQKLSKQLTLTNHDLSLTKNQLQSVKKQLIDCEKMAALGRLVAGITHEVNTPLGIAITTNSIINEEHQQLTEKITTQQLSMKDMDHYCQTVKTALSMQEENLSRAKKLIANFKKTAVDQHQLELEDIDIKRYYKKVVSTLNSILKTKKVSIAIKGDEHTILSTYPGVHAQIITNLITNSVRHGFTGIENNHIDITIARADCGEITIHYQDNGIGLTDQVQKRVFEPFYTTAKSSGGIGLGMSIVLDLITTKLHGTISLEPSASGARFCYCFNSA